MDIFDIAIKMEVEGATFYRELASRSQVDGFKAIFTMLAEDEDRHKETFEAMKENRSVPPSSADASVRAAQIFKQFSKDEILQHTSEIELYQKALDIEQRSIDYYNEQLEATEDTAQKRIITKIIEEERRHYELIDDIIVMVERPERWVEDAEFGVREEY
ncbi:MAG: ferritin family protein [Sphaerochaetaceae bacterium]|jgi:rubrerythrin